MSAASTPTPGARAGPGAGGDAGRAADRRAGRAAGRLYLVPNLLGAVEPAAVLPARTLEVARGLRHFAVETPKAARAFLKSAGMDVPIASLDIRTLPAPDAPDDAFTALLGPVQRGEDLGIVSDAGCPGVADPGARLVAAAHRHAVRVVPLVGPSAILLALMAAGMNGQRFAFHGYLPVKPDARVAALQRLEREARAEGTTQLFIETPYRNAALLAAAVQALAPRTELCVAGDLTLPTETIERRAIAAWRGEDFARFERRPAIFLLCA
jgi:16S rRNA (cytidine1402-2'-O)-methyltransferase